LADSVNHTISQLGIGIDKFLHQYLDVSPILYWSAVTVILLVVCLASYLFTRGLIIRLIHASLRRTRNKWDDLFIEKRVFVPLSLLAPVIVFNYAGSLIHGFPQALLRLAYPLAIFAIVMALDRLLSAGLEVYRRKPIARRWPMKGYVQVVKLLLYISAGIIAVCQLLDQSPWAFLSSIGALTAFLLLIFRDTILSFVAGIQIVSNDLMRVGDWIEMPKFNADGEVTEIALYTVKVQNWDKTITTIPTYRFMEQSFKNWRGMKISGGRRIKRSIYIDQLSVRFCDMDMIKKFRKIQLLQNYIDAKLKELDEYNRVHDVDDSVVVNGRRMTNLGTFRAYLVEYLRSKPEIRNDMTFLVRQKAPGPDGLPLEIYVFAADTKWANYEAIQSDIFDHVLACVGEFGLRVYQRPSGHDLGALCAREEAKTGRITNAM